MDLLPPARAIFLTGFMGTGKTTTGRRLASRLALAFVDTDEIVETLSGRSIPDIFARDGEDAFRAMETQALRKAIERGPAVVSTGGGIMLRDENVRAMREAGPIICLQASPETIIRRTGRRGDRPLLECDDPLQRVRQLLAARAEAYSRADAQVSSDLDDRNLVLDGICRALAADPRSVLYANRSFRIPVSAGNGHYCIHVQRGAFRALHTLCPARKSGARCLVVSTAPVAALYADRVLEGLARGGWDAQLVCVPEGEQAKSLEGASRLYDALIDAGVDSGGMVYALGGGVVGDLAGFVAATYRRGVGFAQLPTTLLAQVDASSGGKVAVNHPRGKNLIGAFYQPCGVVVDTETLASLPERDLRAGLAEVVKHAAIADAGLFRYLETQVGAFLGLDDVAVRYVVARNCQIKAKFVEQDPLDRGARACLNYGHTVGHAVEKAAGVWDLRHGEAVAIGMAAEAWLAVRMGVCSEETAQRQVGLLKRVGLPVGAAKLDFELAKSALLQDKKIASGRLRIPLVPQIGKVRLLQDVDPAFLVEALGHAIQPNDER
ncbi:MAG: 3-dehydroquinate synthase [Acidobacteriota bacterium]|nr:3-dehydroquinate synthase [Acidobacteriota bacterium]